MTATFETLCQIDEALERSGHPPLTDWWRGVLERFYAHPTARTLVARVGRGGAKSHTSVKVSLNEVLAGDWPVPRGEIHWWVYVSTSKEEAATRLNLIERFLLDLGFDEKAYVRSGDTIVLTEFGRGWRVLACQIAAVSGPRAFGYVADELTKWRSADRLANPAGEVIASANAMTVTHRTARKLLISSPLGMVDYHYKRFALGDTAEQLVAQAPTWVANPSVTEAQTRELEPDERIWRREYQAVPQAGALSVFEPEAIARAFKWPTVLGPSHGRIGVIDASSGRKDTWSWGTCGWRDAEGRRRLVFDRVRGFEGTFWSQRAGDQIVQAVADALKAERIFKVVGDQRESLMLRSAFARHGIRFHEVTWTAPAKERAVATLRRWLVDDLLLLPEHEKLRDELLEFEERTTTTGAFTFGARGDGHDDYVALLLTAAMADAERLLVGSPSRRNSMLAALENAPPPTAAPPRPLNAVADLIPPARLRAWGINT